MGLTLLEGALVIVVTYLAARLARWLVRRASRNAHWDIQLVLLVGRVFYVVVLAIGLLALLSVIAPNLVAPALGVAGLLGLAFGLAFQDVLRNWLSGFFLLLERPFRIGDDISIGELTGTVETVELRATVLRTLDGRKIMLPNQMVFTSPLVNLSFYPSRQTLCAVRIPSDRDPSEMLRDARAEISRVEGVAPEPTPTIALVPSATGDTQLQVRYWIDGPDTEIAAVEREVNARMVFVVAGRNISANDLAVTRQAPFLKTPPQAATPRSPVKVSAARRLLSGRRPRSLSRQAAAAGKSGSGKTATRPAKPAGSGGKATASAPRAVVPTRKAAAPTGKQARTGARKEPPAGRRRQS